MYVMNSALMECILTVNWHGKLEFGPWKIEPVQAMLWRPRIAFTVASFVIVYIRQYTVTTVLLYNTCTGVWVAVIGDRL